MVREGARPTRPLPSEDRTPCRCFAEFPPIRNAGGGCPRGGGGEPPRASHQTYSMIPCTANQNEKKN